MLDEPSSPNRRRPGFDSKNQLSEKVAAYVREGIMVGELRGGEFIRTERLADDLGVSATPVREALMILHSEGAVRWEPRRGFRVVAFTEKDVLDLFDVQAYIAGELASRAAAVLTAEDVDRLESIQHELERAAGERDTVLVDSCNHEIHRTINKASSSDRMTALLNLTVQYVPLRYFGAVEGWADASAHDHSAIFNALRRCDGDAARTAMSEHIVHVGQLLLHHLEATGVISRRDVARR